MPDPGRILLIDDDELSREILVLLLEDAGYTVVPATCGEEALELLDAAVDVVLADLQMPGIAGAALAAEIRLKADSLTAMLCMSGSVPRWSAGEMGYDGFLLKPFSMEEMSAAIARVPMREPVGGHPAAATLSDDVDAEVLDGGTLAKLQASMRQHQVEEMYRFALEDAERQIGCMRQAVDSADDVLYRRSAHSMKGSFGMLGIRELQAVMAGAERVGVGDVAHQVTTFRLFSSGFVRLRHTLVARGICPEGGVSHSEDGL